MPVKRFLAAPNRQSIRDTVGFEGKISMRNTMRLAIASALGVCLLAQAPPSTTLKVGDKVPDFTLPSTAGGTVHLADYIGKSTVVLAFFPAAFTGG